MSTNKTISFKKKNTITNYLKKASNSTKTEQYYRGILANNEKSSQCEIATRDTNCNEKCIEKIKEKDEEYTTLLNKYNEQKKLNGKILKLLAVKDDKINILEQQLKDLQKLSVDEMYEKYKNVFTRAQLSELRRIPESSRNDHTYIKRLLSFMIENGDDDIRVSTINKLKPEVYEIVQEMFESRIKSASSNEFDYSSRYNEKKFRKHVSTILTRLRPVITKQNDLNVQTYELLEEGDDIEFQQI